MAQRLRTIGQGKNASVRSKSKATQPKKDIQTVTPEGTSIEPLIHGVIIRHAVTLVDDRGTLCEILNPAWGVHSAPLTYVYQFTIRPGKIKGWHVHHQHDDRIFISQGEIRVVLFDDRPESPTYRMINEIYRTESERSIMIIPAFVFHAHQNIGNTNALLISSPTRVYNHADPDVFRLPIENDYIPYKFEEKPGW